MNPISERKVFLIQIRFASPLSVSSGEGEWTDADVLRDFDGNPFIPGSSLAGAMRSYLKKEKDTPCMLGYSVGNALGKMSSLYISDLTFEGEIVSGIRDGVELNENKVSVTGSKYDREILEAGARGYFYLELLVRQNDDRTEMEKELAAIFQGINAGEIRLGSKKTRGFGAFQITSLFVHTYTKDNYLEYAKAYEKSSWENCPDESAKWLNRDGWKKQMIEIKVPLRMKGGISIRQYTARKNEPDFVHLTDHGAPVIPGSSFAGAIRHRIRAVFCELEEQGQKLSVPVEEILDRAFGYAEKDKGCISNIWISEAEIKESHPLTIMRTGISRFEAAVKDGTLYKERTYVDGCFTLEIAVRIQENPKDTRWMLGILLLALKDLQNGFLSVGGQTAVGRGVFCQDGPILIDGEAGREDDFISEILNCLA